MKMIVGLGNPGKEYEETRHNVGFMIVSNFARQKSISMNKSKFDGMYGEGFINGEKIILLKPMSFMNLSGKVVLSFANYFNISPSEILVVSDDLDLPFLKFRLRLFGSCGGHNGLRNIEKCLGTNQFRRFRVGISSDKFIGAANYVLGKFSNQELKDIDEFLPKSVDVLDCFCSNDFEVVMNKFNMR